MRAGQRIAVIVPAYDEQRHIAQTLRAVPDYVDRILVVDDASTDATAERAACVGDPRVRVLRHGQNRGVGAALKTGYRAALAERADAVVVMAGDGQMDPADLPALLAPVLAGDADYAKGNRLAQPELVAAMPWQRRLGNRGLSALTRVCLGVRVRDSQCGYTVLSARALGRIPLEQLWEGYGYPNDLLGWLSVSGARVRDVPVRAVYGSEVSGIGMRHALLVIPYVIGRAMLRRVLPARLLATGLRAARAEPE